jgi:hypothetical protein
MLEADPLFTLSMAKLNADRLALGELSKSDVRISSFKSAPVATVLADSF